MKTDQNGLLVRTAAALSIVRSGIAIVDSQAVKRWASNAWRWLLDLF